MRQHNLNSRTVMSVISYQCTVERCSSLVKVCVLGCHWDHLRSTKVALQHVFLNNNLRNYFGFTKCGSSSIISYNLFSKKTTTNEPIMKKKGTVILQLNFYKWQPFASVTDVFLYHQILVLQKNLVCRRLGLTG